MPWLIHGKYLENIIIIRRRERRRRRGRWQKEAEKEIVVSGTIYDFIILAMLTTWHKGY